jgi:hypothetical protein
MSKRHTFILKDEREEEDREERMLKEFAKLMRGVKPQKRSHFNSPEREPDTRHAAKEELKDKIRNYNAGSEVEND